MRRLILVSGTLSVILMQSTFISSSQKSKVIRRVFEVPSVGTICRRERQERRHAAALACYHNDDFSVSPWSLETQRSRQSVARFDLKLVLLGRNRDTFDTFIQGQVRCCDSLRLLQPCGPKHKTFQMICACQPPQPPPPALTSACAGTATTSGSRCLRLFLTVSVLLSIHLPAREAAGRARDVPCVLVQGGCLVASKGLKR